MDFTHQGQRLFAMQDARLIAEITFPVVDDTTWVVEHIWIDHKLDQPAIAHELLDAVCALATAEQKQLLALDPFARRHLPAAIRKPV